MHAVYDSQHGASLVTHPYKTGPYFLANEMGTDPSTSVSIITMLSNGYWV